MHIVASRCERFALAHLTGLLVFALIAVAIGELFGFAMWFGLAMVGDDNSLGAPSTSTPAFWILNGIRVAMASTLGLAIVTRVIPSAARWCARALGAALISVLALFVMFAVLLVV